MVAEVCTGPDRPTSRRTARRRKPATPSGMTYMNVIRKIP
jgi:hypothetical protein